MHSLNRYVLTRQLPVAQRLCLRFAVFTAFAAILVGCGGGGGDSPPPPPPEPPPPPQPWVDPFPRQTNVPPPVYSDAELTRAFETFNAVRQQAGLGLLKQNLKLDVAAQAHSDYIRLNRVLTHSEVAGNPGFTGERSADRAAAAGYGTPEYMSEVAAYISTLVSGEDAVMGLMSAPYHRVAMLQRRPVDIGIGRNAKDVPGFNFNIGFPTNGRQGAPGQIVTIWPIENATNVDLSGCCEIPDPLPELNGKPWGYPVSIQADDNGVLGVTSFVLQGPGGVVQTKLLTSATDLNLDLSKAVLMPLAPLQPNTTYTVTFTGSARQYPVNRTWSFTTGTTIRHF